MLKYLSLFSGIGAFESALSNLGVNYEVVNYCEIDKYASKSYSVIHGVPETKNLWDITEVNVFNLPKPGEIDLVTYGFPCQDISLAGKQKGLFNDDGSLTRSGLFFEALKVIEYCKPKVAIAENVKNLTGKKFATQFETVLKSLEEAGYNNYWKVLNAKDYGIPQNRERVFIVSIRKDVDTELFEFPKPYSLEKRLKDFLEPHVDEKYYLSDTQIKRMQTTNFYSNNFETRVSEEDEIVNTLCARDYKDPKCVQVGNIINNGNWNNPQRGRIYSPFGISPSLNCCGGGGLEVKIILNNATKRGYIYAYDGDSVDLAYPKSRTRRGRVKNGISGTLTTSDNMAVVDNSVIRKLTPREYYRLMGFSDAEFDRAEKVNSNTQLYKQAGNSIVVDVLEELFCMLLDEKGDFYI